MKLVLQVASGVILAVSVVFAAKYVFQEEWHRREAARYQARIAAHVKETCESKSLSRERDFDHFMCSGWPAPTKP